MKINVFILFSDTENLFTLGKAVNRNFVNTLTKQKKLLTTNGEN